MCKYPNIELLEFVFKNIVDVRYRNVLVNAIMPECKAEMFLQAWPNSACGIDFPNTVSNQSFTKAYTTIFELNWYLKGSTPELYKAPATIYGVCFGDKPAYAVLNPSEKFFEDWRNHQMAPISKAAIYDGRNKK